MRSAGKSDGQQLHKYGTAELETLLKFYGETPKIEYEGNVFSTPADVDKTETRHEWKTFKLVIFEEKSLSLKELATLFLRNEAKCVTFPNIKICSPLPWCFLCLLQLLSAPLVI